jgi:putative FmdB family regulatory protein
MPPWLEANREISVMPLYTYKCQSCGTLETAFRKIAERNHAPECHGDMSRIIEAPAVQPDLPSYQSPIDGRWIDGKRQRTEDLRRNGCRPWEGMESERKEAIKRADEADRKLDSALDKGLHETLNHMGVEKRRILESAI